MKLFKIFKSKKTIEEPIRIPCKTYYLLDRDILIQRRFINGDEELLKAQGNYFTSYKKAREVLDQKIKNGEFKKGK